MDNKWLLTVNFIGLVLLVIAIVRLIRVERQLAELIPAKPIWATVQTKIAKDLTHPEEQFHEMDELLRRLEALTITEEERIRLQVLLEERATSQDPEVLDEEKDSAKLMIGVMGKVLEEAASSDPIVNIGPVGSKETKKE